MGPLTTTTGGTRLTVNDVGANAANDIVDIEGVGRFIENDLVVNADDEDTVIAHHKRETLKLVGELPADRFLDGECAIEKATRDTVFDFNRRHTGETNGGCKSCRVLCKRCRMLVEPRFVGSLAFVDATERIAEVVVGELLKNLVHLNFEVVDPGFQLVEAVVVDLGRGELRG